MPNPKTGEPTNAERRERAAKTLEFYKYQQLREGGGLGVDDITDLLTDLRHYCEEEFSEYGGKQSLDDCYAISEQHFDHEAQEEKT